MNSITIEEVKELPKDSYQLIDIRDAESIAHGAIPGAIAAPQEDILSCEEVDPSKKFVAAEVNLASKQPTSFVRRESMPLVWKVAMWRGLWIL